VAQILRVFPQICRPSSLARLKLYQAAQMAIVALKRLLGDSLRPGRPLMVGPQRLYAAMLARLGTPRQLDEENSLQLS